MIPPWLTRKQKTSLWTVSPSDKSVFFIIDLRGKQNAKHPYDFFVQINKKRAVDKTLQVRNRHRHSARRCRYFFPILAQTAFEVIVYTVTVQGLLGGCFFGGGVGGRMDLTF